LTSEAGLWYIVITNAGDQIRRSPLGYDPEGFPFLSMKRTTILVDGFNLYHSIKDLERQYPETAVKWLDLRSFCCSFLHLFGKDATLDSVLYFSAYAHHLHDPENVSRHKTYVSCLAGTGVQTIMGKFKPRRMVCPLCHQTFTRNDE
jgi:hypothetical protein